MKTIEEKFKKLDDISHCLLRPSRYIGSVNPHTATTYVVNDEGKIVKEEITWCPALVKAFDEVISNSVDFSKTEDGKHLDTIKVSFDRGTGLLSVHDNGGIAVVKHKEHDQWLPEMIFELKAGSNFNDEDDSVLTGQNGEGAALTAIFSESFTVKTADGKHMFQQTHTENSRRKSEPKIIKSANQLTHIDWVPDYAKLNLEGLDEGNYKKLVKRVYDIAGCNPKLRIFLNGKHIHIRSFEDYVALYADQYAYDQNDNWRIGVSKAYDGFEHVSFVNTTQTNIGGVHIIYVINQITEKLREYFKKKHKVEVKPADIRNHICLFVDATIQKPRYNGQTKDDLVSEVRTWGTNWECPDKLIQKILKLDVVESILDWVKAREAANLNAELRKMAKDNTKADPRKVDKFSDANEKKDRHQCELYLAEGDCIDETTEIVSVVDGEVANRPVGSLRCGDLVLTHLGRYRRIEQMTYSIKSTIEILTTIGPVRVSPTHRVLAYSRETRTFDWVEAQNLMLDHQLVRSTLIDITHADILKVEQQDDGLFYIDFELFGEQDQYVATPSHRFHVFDIETLEYGLVESSQIVANRHFLSFRDKYDIPNRRIENEISVSCMSD